MGNGGQGRATEERRVCVHLTQLEGWWAPDVAPALLQECGPALRPPGSGPGRPEGRRAGLPACSMTACQSLLRCWACMHMHSFTPHAAATWCDPRNQKAAISQNPRSCLHHRALHTGGKGTYLGACAQLCSSGLGGGLTLAHAPHPAGHACKSWISFRTTLPSLSCPHLHWNNSSGLVVIAW